MTVLSCYALQVGLGTLLKILRLAAGYCQKSGYGLVNKEGEHILEFAVAHNLGFGNSYFTKKDNHLMNYQSGGISNKNTVFLQEDRMLSW